MKKLLLAVVLLVSMQHLVYADPYPWRGIVIHHSGSDNGSVETIRTQHVDINDWDYIGYHYVIERSGKTYQCRPINKIGAHDNGNKWHKERNTTHIGICLIGDKTFTTEQKEALAKLLDDLYGYLMYPLRSIERHHELCPGPGLDVEALDERYNKKGGE